MPDRIPRTAQRAPVPVSRNHAREPFPDSLAVWMRVSFLGLPVGLQAVIQLMQQLRDHWIAHLMSHPVEILGQLADAVAGPAQASFRVAARGGLHQLL